MSGVTSRLLGLAPKAVPSCPGFSCEVKGQAVTMVAAEPSWTFLSSLFFTVPPRRGSPSPELLPQFPLGGQDPPLTPQLPQASRGTMLLDPVQDNNIGHMTKRSLGTQGVPHLDFS